MYVLYNVKFQNNLDTLEKTITHIKQAVKIKETICIQKKKKFNPKSKKITKGEKIKTKKIPLKIKFTKL